MDQVQTMLYLVQQSGRSIRSVAKEFGVSRNALRGYLRGAPVGTRRPPERPAPVLSAVRDRMNEILADSANWTAGKQKLTATRLRAMLAAEGFKAGRTLVSEYFAEWKRRRQEVYIPLIYPPGDSAQNDFFEVWVDLPGGRTKAYLFLMRLMHAKRDFAWIYAKQDQLSFLDGHRRAFEHFGGVPSRMVYDNLKAAVTRLIGPERQLSEKFAAVMRHYGFEACFARPGEGHDKGGVESRGKSVRWNHLVPIPAGGSLDEISAALLSRLDAQYDRAQFDEEARHLRPLPAPFSVYETRYVWTGSQSLVRLEGAFYSVPSEWARLEILSRIFPDRIEFVYQGVTVKHSRIRGGERSIDYRHYLREFGRKPQALRQVAPQLLDDLGEPFRAVYSRLVGLHGPREAARLFAEILRLMPSVGTEMLSERLAEALKKDGPLLFSVRGSEAVLADGSIPEAMRVNVESAKASDYDALLTGGAL